MPNRRWRSGRPPRHLRRARQPSRLKRIRTPPLLRLPLPVKTQTLPTPMHKRPKIPRQGTLRAPQIPRVRLPTMPLRTLPPRRSVPTTFSWINTPRLRRTGRPWTTRPAPGHVPMPRERRPIRPDGSPTSREARQTDQGTQERCGLNIILAVLTTADKPRLSSATRPPRLEKVLEWSEETELWR